MSNGNTFDELVALAKSPTYLSEPPERIRTLYGHARPDPRLLSNNVERAVASVVDAYQRKDARKFLKFASEATRVGLIGPLIGDPAIDWPFARAVPAPDSPLTHGTKAPVTDDEALTVSDRGAIAWLPVVAAATDVTPKIRRFVRVMLCTIRRKTWRPAARAMAALALRDDELRHDVATAFRVSFPRDLSSVSSFAVADNGTVDSLPAEYRPLSSVHRRRHVYVAACDLLARGGSLSGESIGDLLRVPAASLNDTDLSAALLGWHELITFGDESTHDRLQETVEALTRRARSTPLIQTEAVLRDIVSTLPGTGLAIKSHEAVFAFLRAPRWRNCSGAGRMDALWSWLETARWANEKGFADEVTAMRRTAAEGERAFQLFVDRQFPQRTTGDIDATIARLGIVADPDCWATTPEECRVLTVVELINLLDRPEVSNKPWEALLRCSRRPSRGDAAADGASPLSRNGAGTSHRVDLAVLLVARDSVPHALLRDLELDEHALLRLAGAENTFIAGQAAVQAERLLRERSTDGRQSTGSAQLRLLWRILQQNPPKAFLTDLLAAVRGADTPLHALIESLAALDLARGDAQTPAKSSKEIAECYVNVAHAAQRLCAGEPTPTAADRLVGVAVAFQRVVTSTLTPGGAEWLDLVRTLVRPAPPPSKGSTSTREYSTEAGLIGWLVWADSSPDGDEPSAIARARARIEAWRALDEAALAAFASEPNVTVEQCRAVATAVEGLIQTFSNSSWPETTVLDRFTATFHEWQRKMESRAVRREILDAEARRLVDASDCLGIVELLERVHPGERIVTANMLPASTVQIVHRFLLECGKYAEADRLRTGIATRTAQRELATARVRHALDASDETALVSILGLSERKNHVDDIVDHLDTATIQATHQYLVDCLNFSVANRLRRAVAAHVRLPLGIVSRAPLFAGAAAGIWLVLDIVPAWSSLMTLTPARWWMLVTVSHVLAFFLLALLMMQGGWGRTTSLRLRRLGRLSYVYLQAAAVAFLATAALILLFAGTETVDDSPWADQFPLWGSLALFLGVFVGLILQGRSPVVRR